MGAELGGFHFPGEIEVWLNHPVPKTLIWNNVGITTEHAFRWRDGVRRAFVVLAWLAAFTSAPADAQRGMEGSRSSSTAGGDRSAPSSSSTPRHSSRSEDSTPAPSGMRDQVRPQSPQSTTRPQDQRAREPMRAEPIGMPDRTRRADPEPSPPSPAQQLQQQQFEQQQLQRQHSNPKQQAAPPDTRGVRCSAHPVCLREPGRYGSCQGVAEVYASASAGRRDIASKCVQANSPDSCNCAAQCTRVAQCSKF
jgi:hypothetical protein